MAKPRLSGAQRRKIAKEKAEQALTATGVLVPLPRELSTLNTVRDYRREINATYRDYHNARIARESMTARAFVLNTGAALAKAEMELEELVLAGSPRCLDYFGVRASPEGRLLALSGRFGIIAARKP